MSAVVVVIALAVAVVWPTVRGSFAAAADAPATFGVVVRLTVRGTERSPGRAYPLEARCLTADGRPVAPAAQVASGASPPAVAFTLTASASMTVGVTEFPTLTSADSCTVTAAGTDGGETSYRTSQPNRADGSAPDAAPGVLEAGRYHSAPARATGQTVTVTHAFNGDLQLSARVAGVRAAGAAAPTVAVDVRCDSGFVQSLRLGDAQTQLVTGVPVGAVCRVTDAQGSGARFADTSGDPFDGIVTIVATPASCWDLRVTGTECRVGVTITLSAGSDPSDGVVTTTTSASTTTSPSTTSPPTTAVAAATTAAPAVTPAPATPVEATPNFTG